MKLFKTAGGIVLEHEQQYYIPGTDWDTLINRKNCIPI